MIIYHGSTVKVKYPEIRETAKALDFGDGFYLTSDFKQAKKWAFRQFSIRKEGEPIVTVYEVDIEKIKKDLRVLEFATYNLEWLNYVADNRMARYIGKKYDLVIGAIADDNTIPVISQYMSGFFSEKIAIELLLPQKYTDQFTFKTPQSLEYLKYKETRRFCNE